MAKITSCACLIKIYFYVGRYLNFNVSITPMIVIMIMIMIVIIVIFIIRRIYYIEGIL